MNVGELKEILQYVDDDVEVRMAQQPNWPFEYSVRSVQVIELELEDDQDEPVEVVYLEEGTQFGYLPGQVSRQLGWRN